MRKFVRIPDDIRETLLETYRAKGAYAADLLAKELGIGSSTIRKYVRLAGVKPPPGSKRKGGQNRKITDDEREEILRVFVADGLAAATILATSHGLHPEYARKLASERGLPLGPRPDTSKLVTFNGEQMRLSEAVRAAGSLVSRDLARVRITTYGWSVERAVTETRGGYKLDEVTRRERELARWREKSRRKKAERAAARAPILAAKGISKTAPEYRKVLPRMGEMSKSELRAMLAQAARNTAQLAEAAE